MDENYSEFFPMAELVISSIETSDLLLDRKLLILLISKKN
jgi:hypothetical protein